MKNLFTLLILSIMSVQLAFPALVEARSGSFRSGGYRSSYSRSYSRPSSYSRRQYSYNRPTQRRNYDNRQEYANRDRGSNWKTAASAAGGAVAGSVIGNALSGPQHNGYPMYSGGGAVGHGAPYMGNSGSGYVDEYGQVPQQGIPHTTVISKPMGFWGFIYSFLKPLFDLFIFLLWLVALGSVGVVGYISFKRFSGKVK